jgi:peptidyl-prolyl cis-trans isomerase B (cyclophilin B)
MGGDAVSKKGAKRARKPSAGKGVDKASMGKPTGKAPTGKAVGRRSAGKGMSLPSRAGKAGGPAVSRASREGASRRRRRLSPVAVLAIVAVVVSLVGAGVFGIHWFNSKKEAAANVTYTVRMETSKGSVVMEVYGKPMPVTVANFKKLADAGFYDGLTWHRVENWVVQTGDPTGTGSGGSPDRIKLETSPELKNVRGAVGMARSEDPNSATSQFYILRTDAAWLDEAYAVFGRVVEGLDVVDKLVRGDTVVKLTIETAAEAPK